MRARCADFVFTVQGAVRLATENPKRVMLLIQNTGQEPAYLQFNRPARDGEGIVIYPGGSFCLEHVCPVDEIRAYAPEKTELRLLEASSL